MCTAFDQRETPGEEADAEHKSIQQNGDATLMNPSTNLLTYDYIVLTAVVIMDNFLRFGIYSVLKVAGLMFGLFAHVFLEANSEIYNIDGSKGLKWDREHGLEYANFALHNSRYLNITPFVSV